MRVLFTTNPGIEDIVVEEARAKLGARPLHVAEKRGRVIVDVGEDKLYLIDTMRSIHRARILLAEAEICPAADCLKTLHEVVASSRVGEYVTPHTSFAVRAERAGEHEYSSLDIARVAGDAVIEAVKAVYGERPPVDLDYPNVIVSVDVIHDRLYLGIELGGDLSWHRRGYRVYEHPAALKPTLAYAMIMLSQVADGDTLMDPMCGGGTIPIEAAYLLEDSTIYCLDYNPRHIEGAKLNALAAMVYNRIRFIHGDARRLTNYVDRVDIVVSNPPYGIRMGDPRRVRELYKRFISELARVLEKRAVIITTEHEHVKEYADAAGLRVAHERLVAHGGLWPKILVLAA